jgi:hypothetical protein
VKALGPAVEPTRGANKCLNGNSLKLNLQMNHWRGGYKRNYSFLIIPACFPLFTAVPPQPTAIRELQDISFSEKNSHIASKMFADDLLLSEISKLILVLVTNTHALPLFYIYD